MSIYANVGGSGNGGASIAANTAATISLCTTPNTANQLYLVTVQVAIEDPIMETGTNDVLETGSQDWAYGYGYAAVAPNLGHGYNQTMKVGPNQAIKIAIANQSAVSSNYDYTYQYVGIIIDTN
jgi:hypothetical protein